MPDFEAETRTIPDDKGRDRRVHAIQRKQAAWQLAINSVENQAFFVSQAANSGRIYSSFTSFPKALRRFALLDGEETVEIDIRNSQPLLLASFYPSPTAEAERYRGLAEAGQVYEAIMRADGLGNTAEERERLKRRLYAQVLFGPNNRHFELLPVFRSEFPELSELIWQTKKDDHSRLAIELQRREAEVMIRRVVPRLAGLLPGVPVLTVHDSLVIAKRHAEPAGTVIREEFQASTGLNPSLRFS